MALTPIQKLVGEKLRRLDQIPERFKADLGAIEVELLRRMEEVIDQFDTVGGVIAMTDANLALASQMAELVTAAIMTPEYTTLLQEFALSFGEQAEITDRYMTEVFGQFTPIDNKAAFIRAAQQSALSQLTGSAISFELGVPIQQAILASVQTGARKTEVVAFVRDFLTKGPSGEGRLAAYAGTIVDTSFSVFDRSYTQAVSKSLDVKFWRYAGTIIKTTRQFCRQRAGKYFTTEEVKSWGSQTWAGQIQGTNEENIFAFCGGWNCRHSLLPVSELPK